MHGDNHRRVLAALGLVDGDGVGQLQLFQLLEAVLHPLTLVELHGEKLSVVVDLPDDAHVAVEDSAPGLNGDSVAVHNLPLHLVVVPDLHDLVAHPVDGAAGFLFRLGLVRRI